MPFSVTILILLLGMVVTSNMFALILLVIRASLLRASALDGGMICSSL